LRPGHGCYAAYLRSQGRMTAGGWVYGGGGVMLLRMLGDVKPTLLARLDQLIFSEDVQLGDVTDTFMGLGVVGPQSAVLLSSVLEVPEHTLRGLPRDGNLRASFASQSAIVLN